jgi:hypothetical protein
MREACDDLTRVAELWVHGVCQCKLCFQSLWAHVEDNFFLGLTLLCICVCVAFTVIYIVINWIYMNNFQVK